MNELSIDYLLKREPGFLPSLETVDDIIGLMIMEAMEIAHNIAEKKGAKNPIFRSFLEYSEEQREKIYSVENKLSIPRKKAKAILSVLDHDAFQQYWDILETQARLADNQSFFGLVEKASGEINYNKGGLISELTNSSGNKHLPQPLKDVFSGPFTQDRLNMDDINYETARRNLGIANRTEYLKLIDLIACSRLGPSRDLFRKFSSIKQDELSPRHNSTYQIAKGVFENSPWYLRV